MGGSVQHSVRRSGVVAAWLIVACGGGERAPGQGAPVQTAAPDAPQSAAAPAAEPGGSATAKLRDPVPLTVTAALGGATARYTGLGECHHTTDASIYQVPATQWSAQLAPESGDLRYLSLTLWQPKGAAGLQVSLGLTIGETTSDIATVKGAPVKGTASGRAVPKGAGGVLEVEGTDAAGVQVRVSVACERWTEPVAEGG